MGKRDLGIAVVGAGRVGSLRARLAAAHPSVRFVAISDLDAVRAAVVAKQVGAEFASGDNCEVIDRPEVDAVIVSTSEPEHAAPVLHALERGKPVLIEKPIALTFLDADRMVAAAHRTGVELRVGYTMRFQRRYLVAKEQIAQGRLGRIVGGTGRLYNTRAHGLQILQRRDGGESRRGLRPSAKISDSRALRADGDSRRQGRAAPRRGPQGEHPLHGGRVLPRARGSTIWRPAGRVPRRRPSTRARRWRSRSPSSGRPGAGRP